VGEIGWYRLKPGLIGLKPLMPARSIQWAQTHGYGWPRHYEPVPPQYCTLCGDMIKEPIHAN
jgi:hypothetical protein